MVDTFRKVSVAAFCHALGTDCPNSQDQIVSLLRLSGVASSNTIIDWLYGGDVSGGPENALQCVRVLIHHLRRRGFSIKPHWGRGYILERMGRRL